MPFKPLKVPAGSEAYVGFRKKRLLWVSVSPFHSSSFSVVSKNLLTRLKGFEVLYAGQHYLGEPKDLGYCKLASLYDVRQIPHYMDVYKPDITLIFQAPPFLQGLNPLANEIKKRTKFLIVYSPIEGFPLTLDVEEIFSKADKMLVPSRYSQQCLQRQGFNSEVVEHGVNCELFNPHPYPDKFTVGTVTSHVWRKQIDRLIDAHRMVRTKNYPIDLLIYASTYDSTPWMPNITKYARITNPEAYFNPSAYQNIPASHENLKGIYAKFTVLANPVTEGFGLTALEAMAMKRVPIVITHGASPEVVGDCGIYVKIKDYLTINVGKVALVDVEDLAEKIMWAFENPEKLNRLAEKGRERAETFTWEKPAKKLVEVLTNAV